MAAHQVCSSFLCSHSVLWPLPGDQTRPLPSLFCLWHVSSAISCHRPLLGLFLSWVSSQICLYFTHLVCCQFVPVTWYYGGLCYVFVALNLWYRIWNQTQDGSIVSHAYKSSCSEIQFSCVCWAVTLCPWYSSDDVQIVCASGHIFVPNVVSV